MVGRGRKGLGGRADADLEARAGEKDVEARIILAGCRVSGEAGRPHVARERVAAAPRRAAVRLARVPHGVTGVEVACHDVEGRDAGGNRGRPEGRNGVDAGASCCAKPSAPEGVEVGLGPMERAQCSLLCASSWAA